MELFPKGMMTEVSQTGGRAVATAKISKCCRRGHLLKEPAHKAAKGQLSCKTLQLPQEMHYIIVVSR